MGRNFVSVCHRCKTFLHHERGKESEGLHSFYGWHSHCMKLNSDYVETLDDQLQETPWMHPPQSATYKYLDITDMVLYLARVFNTSEEIARTGIYGILSCRFVSNTLMGSIDIFNPITKAIWLYSAERTAKLRQNGELDRTLQAAIWEFAK